MMLAYICGLFDYSRLILCVFPVLRSRWRVADHPHAPDKSHIVAWSRSLEPGRWPWRGFGLAAIDAEPSSCMHRGIVPKRHATVCPGGTAPEFFAPIGQSTARGAVEAFHVCGVDPLAQLVLFDLAANVFAAAEQHAGFHSQQIARRIVDFIHHTGQQAPGRFKTLVLELPPPPLSPAPPPPPPVLNFTKHLQDC